MERSRHNERGRAVGCAVLVAAGAFLLSVHPVLAATPFSIEPVDVGLGTADLKATVINIIRWLLGILAIVAFVFIGYGGFLWITAAGNIDRIQKAKRVIINAVIGLIIVLLAWAIVFFVARTILGATNGGGGGPGPGCGALCPPGVVGFEIRSITTDCGTPGNFRNDVFLCSAVKIGFNAPVKTSTAETAMGSGYDGYKLIIKECTDGVGVRVGKGTENCTSVATPVGTAVADQQFTLDQPSGTQNEWVTKSGDSGKAITYFHIPTLLKSEQWYQVTIPKGIQDRSGRTISACRENLLNLVPGCNETADHKAYTWTMMTGMDVDLTAPVVTRTYPDSGYLAGSGAPDRSVPRAPLLITATYDQAIIDPSCSNVEVVPFDPDEGTADDWHDGTDGTPLTCGTIDATGTFTGDYIIVSSGNGTGIQIQFSPAKPLEKFTWYKVSLRGIKDLCGNIQDPDPFEWVFETNDVVPGIAAYYPSSNNACVDTPVTVLFTTSMYDPLTDNCSVNPMGGGYVTAGSLKDSGGTPAPRVFDVAPGHQCVSCPDYWNRCRLFSHEPSSAFLKVNEPYTGDVQTRLEINDRHDTLSGSWSFGTKPAGQCVNAPFITSIQPSPAKQGQCITVYGYSFDPKSDGQAGADDLLFDTNPVDRAFNLLWSDRQIVTTVPTGKCVGGVDDGDQCTANSECDSNTCGGMPTIGSHLYKVRAEFPDPFGILESNDYPFTVQSGNGSTGPCLIRLQPSSGYSATPFTAIGDRLEPVGNTRHDIFFDSNPLSWTLWENTRINTSAPTISNNLLPMTGEVKAENSQGKSNPLYFTVNPTPVGQLVTTDYWPNCTASCTNTDVGARFNLDVDSSTLPGNAIIRKCNDQTCAAFSDTFTPSVVYDPASRAASFPPAPGSLVVDTWYRVILRSDIQATAAAGGSKLTNLNYDDGATGTNNAFSWVFKTGTGASGCSLGRVEAFPANAFLSRLGQTQQYRGFPWSEGNSCSARGQLLNAATFDWAWNSSDNTKAIVAGSTSSTEVATAVDQTVPGPDVGISATATERAAAPISKTGVGYLKIDFTFCDETTDCERGGVCPGSVCDRNLKRCTPVLTSPINPSSGAIGTWVGVSGCYFGGYDRGTCSADPSRRCDTIKDCPGGTCDGGSAVIYHNNKRGFWPNPVLCGSPSTMWSETSITSEVPDRNAPSDLTRSAEDGQLIVQRWDGARTTPSVDSYFDVNATVVPGICKVTPNKGSEGMSVKVTGQNFNDATAGGQGSGKVTFYKEKDVSTYSSWTNTEIMSVAPQGIQNNPGDPAYLLEGKAWGWNEIAVKQNSQWSNVENFTVVPPECSICADDGDCGGSTPQCGYNRGAVRCCVAVPTVTSMSPTPNSVNVCRNAVVNATFDSAMDANTINGTSVLLYKRTNLPDPWSLVSSSQYAVSYNAATKRVSIRPTAGMLDRNMYYRVTLSEFATIRSAEGGRLAMADWKFLVADSPGPCQVDRIELLPTSWTFAKAGPASLKEFNARPLAISGQEVGEVSGTYEWDWGWTIANTGLAKFNPAPTANDTRANVEALPVKGRTTLKACVDPLSTGPPPLGPTKSVCANSYLNVTACTQPWSYTDSSANCTITEAGTSCTDYHFDLDYCMDGGLPSLSFDGASIAPTVTQYKPSGAPDEPQLLKEFLFKEKNPDVRDAIGIRIYDNVEVLSALEWYNKFAPNPRNTTPLIVDGYDAVRDGTTVYVVGFDFDGNDFLPRIYLISYNIGASQQIVSIYNLMLANWFFNNNVTTTCDTGESDKLCVQRDLKRLAALGDIQEYLRSYKQKNSAYPKLAAGTFLPQLSFSAWPSWQTTLGGDLGKSLPVDPKNKIENCPAGQAQDGTCWNEAQKKFICPANSHILGYKGDRDGKSATLYAMLEYGQSKPGSWVLPLPAGAICSAPSDCQCFNYFIDLNPIP